MSIVQQFRSLFFGSSPYPCFIEKDYCITVSSNALRTFVVVAERLGKEKLDDVYIIVDGNAVRIQDLISESMASPPTITIRIRHLNLNVVNDINSSPLSAVVKCIAANVEVTGPAAAGRLSFSSSPSQPIANLCEAIRDMDGGLWELRLDSIDLSGEQRLADTLKRMERLNRLTLNNTGISADALVQIGHELKHKLVSLRIYNESCLQSPDTCGRLFNAIKQSSKIRWLKLTDNKLNGSHLSALPDILPTMKGINFELHLDDFEGSKEFMQQLTQAVGREIASKVKIG